ncbi:hypothetical protein, partial [Plasmodium yoelii yoelii]
QLLYIGSKYLRHILRTVYIKQDHFIQFINQE